jgi:hypothetical protein
VIFHLNGMAHGNEDDSRSRGIRFEFRRKDPVINIERAEKSIRLLPHILCSQFIIILRYGKSVASSENNKMENSFVCTHTHMLQEAKYILLLATHVCHLIICLFALYLTTLSLARTI